MKSLVNIVSISIFVILALLLIEVLLKPTVKKKIKKRRKDLPKVDPDEQRDWRQKYERLEPRVRSLQAKIDQYEKNKKQMDKQLMIEKAKNKKIQEKQNTKNLEATSILFHKYYFVSEIY